MWPNPQETADLVTFTEEILVESFIFCPVLIRDRLCILKHVRMAMNLNQLSCA